MNDTLFIGLQASGKSSFFLKHFYHTHLRLSLDMLKTRHREALLFDACLRAKQPLVIDNTNPTRAERRSYIEKLQAHHFEVVGYYFSSSLDECLHRNRQREGKARIPDVGLLAIYKKLELPCFDEGFDRLYFVRIHNGQFQIEEWQDEI